MKVIKLLSLICFLSLCTTLFSQVSLEISPRINNLEIKGLMGNEQKAESDAIITHEALSNIKSSYYNIVDKELNQISSNIKIKITVDSCDYMVITQFGPIWAAIYGGIQYHKASFNVKTEILNLNDELITQYNFYTEFKSKGLVNPSKPKSMTKFETLRIDAWNKGFEDLKVKILSDKTTIEESLK